MERGNRQNEQGFVLIVAMVMVVLIIGLVASYLTVSASNLQLTGAIDESLQTLFVAETGLANVLHELNESKKTGDPVDTSVFQGKYTRNGTPSGTEIGFYFVESEVLEPSGGTLEEAVRVMLKSTGFHNYERDLYGKPQPGTGRRKAIEVVLKFGQEGDLTKAILTGDDLVVGGDLNVQGDVHTNGRVTGNGNSGSITAAAAENLDLENQPAPTPDSFKGNLTASLGGIDSVAFTVEGPIQDGAAPPVTLPQFDPYEIVAQAMQRGWEIDVRTPPAPGYTEKWQNAADEKTLTSDPTKPGKLIFVKGNVSIKGSITGDVVIVATGDIVCAGNTTLADDTCSLMMYAGGDLTITGTFNVQGVLYTNGDLKTQGTPTIDGLVVAAGEGTCGGTVNINYHRPTLDEQDLFKKWRLVSWREVGPKLDAIP